MEKIMFSQNIEGIVIDRIIRDDEFTMPTKHFHDEYEIYYLLEGSRYYFIENKTYLVRKGSIVFINCNQTHKTGLTESSYHDRILIEITHESFSTFLLSSCNIDLKIFFATNFGVLELDEEGQKHAENLLFFIINEIEQKKEKYKYLVMMKLSELLVFSLRVKKDKLENTSMLDNTKYNKANEIADYIANNYCTVDSLDALSKQFYISKCYLSKIFKQTTGFTVHEYININRIKYAEELLVNSELNITEISNILGYESVTYFGRVFKKYTEISPLKYRQKSLIYLEKAIKRKFKISHER